MKKIDKIIFRLAPISFILLGGIFFFLSEIYTFESLEKLQEEYLLVRVGLVLLGLSPAPILYLWSKMILHWWANVQASFTSRFVWPFLLFFFTVFGAMLYYYFVFLPAEDEQ